MIRALLARARATLNNPAVGMAIAGACLELGVKMFINVITEMREELTAVQQQLAEARMEAAAMAASAVYPAAEDLDPLGHGTDSPIGDQLAEEYDPR